jgi:hypothetical protein
VSRFEKEYGFGWSAVIPLVGYCLILCGFLLVLVVGLSSH